MIRKTEQIIYAIAIVAIFGLCYNFYMGLINPYGWVVWGQLILAIVLLNALLLRVTYNSYKKGNNFKAFSLLSVSMAIAVITILSFVDYRIVFFSESKENLTSLEWKEDVSFLKEIMINKHPGIYKLMDKNKLDSLFVNIEANIETWNDTQIKLELMKVVSMLNDGHSIVPPQPSIDFHCLPFITHKFDDGVFVINAANGYEHINNTELIAINDTPILEVFNKVQPYIGIENEGGEWDRFPLYGSITELLYNSKITDDPLSVDITFKSNDKVFTETITGRSYYQWFYFYFAPNGKNNTQLYEHRMLNNNFWFNYNAQKKELFVNINNLKDQPDESLKSFSNRLSEFVDNNDIDKTILDLRNNRGGDNFKSRVLLNVFRDNPKVNKEGKFFTLISRRTFSAAVNLTSLLENQTKTIFIGEPTGQGPTHFGDAKMYTLPNSSIHVFLSSLKWQGSFEEYDRQSIDPHYVVKYSFKDYINKEDPALKLIDILVLPQPIRHEFKNDLSGEYVFKNEQLVTISKQQNKVFLKAEDFVPGSLLDINTEVYQVNDTLYHTDLRFLKLKDKGGQLSVVINNKSIELYEKPERFKFPIQYLLEGDFQKGVDEISNDIRRYRKYNIESKLNSIGYSLFNSGKLEEATLVFELNTRLYPKSSNSWDSYGESLIEIGKIDKAKQAYLKALELNPENRTSQNMLIKIN